MKLSSTGAPLSCEQLLARNPLITSYVSYDSGSEEAVNLASIKRVARAVIKVIAGVAVLVFIVANPIGDNSGIALIASIIVLVICGVVWAVLEMYGGTDEEPQDLSEQDR